MLNGRRVQIVELNESEFRRATECARRRERPSLRPSATHFEIGDESEGQRLVWHELGAQGEVVVAKVLGVEAPLSVNTFHAPDIPPDWSVKTQLSTSRNMRDRYMRIQPHAYHFGWRHVLVERDIALWGGFVFIVHGWIADEQARRVAVKRHWRDNDFVHLRHLSPLTRDVYDTVYGAPTDEPPAPAPFDTDMGAA
jgi:hypothetical protein